MGINHAHTLNLVQNYLCIPSLEPLCNCSTYKLGTNFLNFYVNWQLIRGSNMWGLVYHISLILDVYLLRHKQVAGELITKNRVRIYFSVYFVKENLTKNIPNKVSDLKDLFIVSVLLTFVWRVNSEELYEVWIRFNIKYRLKSIIFWNITPCSLLSCNRRFGGKYRLNLQGRRNNFVTCHLLTCGFLLSLFLRPWRWRRYFPPKRRLQLNGLHGVISQKIIIFITTAVKTSNPTK
jgi:hypothetical protein